MITLQKTNRIFLKIKNEIRNFELKAIKENKLIINDIEWNYLIHITQNPDLSVTTLAKKIGVQKGTLSTNINSLVKKELLLKKNKRDKRLLELSPTSLGQRYIEIFKKTHKEIQDKIFSLLTIEQYNELVQIGLTIYEGLKK